MLRDLTAHTTTHGNADLTADSMQSVSALLNLVDKRISGFSNYFSKVANVNKENHISFHLVNYFNAQLISEDDGYMPYNFSFVKNPPQEKSSKETDIGVVILNPSTPSTTMFEFEAKRLSDTSNNSEYVHGKRGGIERFKREQHGAHLTICGMFGYVQSKTVSHWFGKINEWISDLATNNTDETIDWKPTAEKLTKVASSIIEKYESSNLRNTKPALKLYHYFINLLPLKEIRHNNIQSVLES